ncbi:MAG: winged helix-turn-helix transcriptional regulator [Anaerolineae bacterium]|nr:winged helix-turn-helix transcriptional regulator [Anaerolineae bacterium]HRX04626.1 winged helix-turn-helix transcriptional regulator [Anaerolineae bacterium]
MGRKASVDRIQEIGKFVERHPGCKPTDVARELGLKPSAVTRSLPAVEDAGILLYEDKKGGLWPFGKQR